MPTPLLFSEFAGSNASTRRIEATADASLGAARGDAGMALRRAVDDALFELLEARERARETRRLTPAGSARGGVRAL